ncbi:hypothetical protein I79_002832 [Cricetulus griseus]|uniref:Uncharacterized protein n=1 Tax=Cricetulus griseus TaxID=10029 RepID=G3GYF6_CRIGR|nr:hypothetical protein I79_002832 [Cricetulus griseus]
MKHHDQSTFRRQVLVWLTHPHHYSLLKEVRTGTRAGQNLEAGPDAEATEECCTLACSTSFLRKNPVPPAQGWLYHNGSTSSITKRMLYRLACPLL